jgi:hypothetical protein
MDTVAHASLLENPAYVEKLGGGRTDRRSDSASMAYMATPRLY